MSDETEPCASANETLQPVSHRRILMFMAAIGLAGGLFGGVFVSLSFGAGVIVGTLLAFANYYWLKYSLKKVFALAAETGGRPRLLGLKYFIRYIVMGGIVAILYAAEAVSIVGLILGLGAFGFAVVLEGVLKIIYRPSKLGEHR